MIRFMIITVAYDNIYGCNLHTIPCNYIKARYSFQNLMQGRFSWNVLN